MATEILRLHGRRRLLDTVSFTSVTNTRMLTSSEVAVALRPFYFSVHPDLFGKFPTERATNESSLQVLSSYIENLQQNRPLRPANLRFFLRPVGLDSPITKKESLKSVNIKLTHRDVKRTVQTILTSCDLPTTYVDNRPDNKPPPPPIYRHRPTATYQSTNYSFTPGNRQGPSEEEVSEKISQAKGSETLLNWLSKNVDTAKMKLNACEPVREEVSRLQEALCNRLGMTELNWECGWNITSFRGCLQALQALAEQHSEDMRVLRGRKLVFGSDTGVSMNGSILLNSAEVRHNWLDFLKNLTGQDEALKKLPHFEKALSQVLRDIQIVRRKFQPHTMATHYENNLRRLTTTLGDCQGRGGYPKDWPNSLNNFELVVESEAGPLMLSPTGQFILPCSCPSFLLVSFISENMPTALELLNKYNTEKGIETKMHEECLSRLGIIALDKDDSVTPQKMIDCCKALLKNSEELSDFLSGVRLTITNYYSVMSDGQMCIPWNWRLN